MATEAPSGRGPAPFWKAGAVARREEEGWGGRLRPFWWALAYVIVTTAAYSIRSPKPHQLPYGALKSGVATFTKALAKAYGASGVRANCVCPGVTETGVLAALRARMAEERGWPVAEALERAMVEDWGMRVALGRAGTPRELGDVIAFLLSERASYVSGALVNVDGGTDF